MSYADGAPPVLAVSAGQSSAVAPVARTAGPSHSPHRPAASDGSGSGGHPDGNGTSPCPAIEDLPPRAAGARGTLSDEQFRAVASLILSAGGKWQDVADLLCVTRQAASHRGRRLGMASNGRDILWTPERVAEAARIAAERGAKAAAKHLGTTTNAVRQALYRAGVSLRWERHRQRAG